MKNSFASLRGMNKVHARSLKLPSKTFRTRRIIMLEKSCGTIPYIIKDGIVYYLLVKSKSGGACGFPKGHVESGEGETETALRETLEETSVKVNINDKFRYEMSYQMGNGKQKTVVYFLASFQDQQPKRNGDFEDFDYLMLPFEKAYQALTFENTKQMLKAANDFVINEIIT